MTIEALKLALEALENHTAIKHPQQIHYRDKAIAAVKEALAGAEGERQPEQDCNYCGGTGDVSGEYPGVACPECNGSGVRVQPEFIKHEVENAEDWSEWVCPNPQSYLMKCCDCGLVHEAQFRVAKYQPEPSEDFVVADDPDLQAQFRMRRNEQWSPKDTAYRPGGLAQPEQDPVVWMYQDKSTHEVRFQKHMRDFVDHGATYETPLYTTPPQRTWVGLTDDEVEACIHHVDEDGIGLFDFAEAIEAKLREKNSL